MRVVWKDSVPSRKTKRPRVYRDFTVQGYKEGWSSGIPGDNNIYRTYVSAQNAIDKALGGCGKTGTANLRPKGIQVKGKDGWEVIE